jgi:hypothetical protein
LIYYLDGWFGLDSWLPGATMIVAAYLLLSLGATAYFLFFEAPEVEYSKA